MAEFEIDLRASEVRKHLKGLRCLAAELLANPTDAEIEDLVHDTLANAAGRTIRERGRLGAYLRAVLTRRHALRLRSEARRRKRELAAASRLPSIDVAMAAESAEEAQLLASVVAELGDADKLVIVRHFYQGLSTAQIAEQDGITDRAVRYRIERALAAVRTRLQQHDPRGWAGVCAAIAIPLPAKAAAGALASKIVITCLLVGLVTIGVVALRSEAPRPDEPAPTGTEPATVAEESLPTGTPPDTRAPSPPSAVAESNATTTEEPPATNTLAIRGTVRAVDGTRIPGIYVEAKADDDSIRFARTAEDGTFTLTGLAPGTYRVKAAARPSIRPGPYSRYSFAADARNQRVHEVAAGAEIDLTINGRHRIDLRLVDRFDQPLDIVVSPLFADMLLTTDLLESEGGRATVFTNSPDAVRFGFGFGTRNSGNFLPTERRLVEPDKRVETYVFEPGAIVRGTIRRDDDTPVGKVSIRIKSLDFRHASVRLKSDKAVEDYELAGLADDAVVLQFLADGLPIQYTRPIPLSKGLASRHDVVLRRGGYARVRVEGFDPKRIHGIQCSFESLTTGEVFTGRTKSRDDPPSNRAYLLLPDDYRVTVRQGDDLIGAENIKVRVDEESERRVRLAPIPK